MATKLERPLTDYFSDIPWGTHFCQFYRTAEDLLEVLVPFFEAGLKNNEYCMIVVSEPLGLEAAQEALSARIPGFDEYVARGQLELLPFDKWYLKDGRFDQSRVLDGWLKRLDKALKEGYSGLRLTGNTFWLERKDWQDFREYEGAVNDVIGKYRIKALCTYNLDRCTPEDIFDVIATHQFSLARQGGVWRRLETKENLMQQELLQEQESRLSAFVEAAPSVIIAMTPDHRITEFNPEAERLYGRKRAEVIGQDYFKLFVPERYWTAVGADMEKVLAGQPTRGFENPVLTPQGERSLQWTIGPLRDASGNVTSVIKLGQDVTERKRIEDSLTRTRDFLTKLIHYANAPIIVWDAQATVTQFNQAFEHLTGYGASEVIGRDLSMLFPETTRLDSLEKIARTSSGEFWESVEIPIRCKDGDVRIALWNSANVYDDNNQLTATIAQGQDITAREQAVEQLRETRNYLEKLLNYANAPVIVWDTDSVITKFNHAFEHMTGYGMAEVLGADLSMLFPEETRADSLEKISRAAAGEFWESVEIPILCKDGDVRIALWNSANIYAEDARTLLATIAQGQDISGRKEAEEALLVERNKVLSILEAMEDGVYILGEDYSIEYLNPVLQREFGEPGGQKCYAYFHDRTSPCPWCPRQAVFEGKTVHWESEFPKVGKVYDLIDTPLTNPDGSISRLEIFRDITQRKETEMELMRTRDYLKKLITYANAPIIVWGTDSVITQFNQAFQRLTGYEAGEVIGQDLRMLFPEDTRSDSLEKIAQTAAGEFWESVEIPILRKDGDVRLALWNSANIYGEDGTTLTATIAQGQDITQRKGTEEQLKSYADRLEASNQELEAFNYSVSHDLRAPLRAIDGFSQILQEDYRDRLDEEGCRVLDVVRDNTRKMGTLIDDLLALSRLGRQQIKPRDVDMAALAGEVFAELKQLNPARSIDFRLGELPQVHADPALIRQIWMNLISNAIKFTEKRETAVIEVTGGNDEGMSYYCVSDNGVGFNMEYADKLFGVFQRLHSDEEFQGTGVGLAIVKRITQRHGGRVWADAEIDKGAKFCFALPMEGGE